MLYLILVSFLCMLLDANPIPLQLSVFENNEQREYGLTLEQAKEINLARVLDYLNTEEYQQGDKCYQYQFKQDSVIEGNNLIYIYSAIVGEHFVPYGTNFEGIWVSNISNPELLDSIIQKYPNYLYRNTDTTMLAFHDYWSYYGTVTSLMANIDADLDPCLSVAITEPVDNQNDFVLKKPFPNPTNGIANIPIETLKGENVEGKLFNYELYDLLGQRVARGQLILQGNSLQADLSKHPYGTYLLTVYCREHQLLFTSVIIKNQ